MKILILVQSSMMPPFDRLFEAQKQTWDSYEVAGVETVYYFSNFYNEWGSNFVGRNDSSYIFHNMSFDYDMMHWRHKLTLDAVWNMEWDYIFRTNSSSYINKELLLEKANTLPLEKCYCGIDGGGFASGCGVFLSRDVVEILKDTIDDYPTPSEDCNMGTILSKKGILVTPGAERCDWYHGGDRTKNHYHYRVKPNDNDRNKDVAAMNELFAAEIYRRRIQH